MKATGTGFNVKTCLNMLKFGLNVQLLRPITIFAWAKNPQQGSNISSKCKVPPAGFWGWRLEVEKGRKTTQAEPNKKWYEKTWNDAYWRWLFFVTPEGHCWPNPIVPLCSDAFVREFYLRGRKRSAEFHDIRRWAWRLRIHGPLLGFDWRWFTSQRMVFTSHGV